MTIRLTIVFTFLFVLAGFCNAGLKAMGKDGDIADNGGIGTTDRDHGKSASPIISSLTSHNQYTYATHAVKIMATRDGASEEFATLRVPEEVNLSVSANVGTEAAATVITVTATAAQAVSGDQTVDLAVSGTGITGTDYTLSGTIITILDGQTTGTVTFTLQDDTDIEGAETATLTISNPSSGLTLGATDTQNVTITDDDFPAVDLSVSTNTGTEAATTVITVTATASEAVSGDQTVDLAVSGTGITGTDYTLSRVCLQICNLLLVS